MPDRHMKERRERIGNISREAYIDYHLRGDKEKVAGSDYDMLTSIKDCVHLSIRELCEQCANRPALCDAKYIKKAHSRVPLSWMGIVGAITLITLSADAAILHGRLLRVVVDFFR